MYDELIPDLVDRVSKKCTKSNIPFDGEDLQSIVCIIVGMSMIEGRVTGDMVENAIRKYFTLFIESKWVMPS